ncbi:MAG: glutamate racemase [Variibacter sp.]|nr:glutamate racemase [Variibacter sp.]
MPRTIVSPTVLVFDSGLGGLTVFREIARARPDAAFVYAADDALFPYGRLAESELLARVLAVMEELVAAHRPDIVVIACNTASTVVLPALRERFAVPFVGTVPAIKPACAASVSKRISVLGTEATVKREYTHALVRQYGHGCRVTFVGSARLAAYAERELAGEPVENALLRAEVAPCFVEEAGARTDTVVLACTHYPLLTARLAALAPWPVRWIDPAPAIARRVVDLIGPPARSAARVAAKAIFTSGRRPSPALAQALRTFGFADTLAAPA